MLSNINQNSKTITISFTEELLAEWTKLYFKEHKRAKKIPIEHASHPSINVWCILPRISMNTLKQNWRSFTEYVVNHYGYNNLGISKCKCKVIIYRSNNRTCDLDNETPKFIWDGLTSQYTGVLVDDNCSVIESLTIQSEVRKDRHEMDVIFYDCEYDKELMLETRIKERKKSRKRKETSEKNKAKKKKKIENFHDVDR